MSDSNRLRDKLAKLSATVDSTGDARDISAPGKQGLLLAILREIDETIMARDLTFQNDRGRTIVFQVAARRLLRLVDWPDKDNISPSSSLLDQPISQASDALAAYLDEFLADTRNLVVRSAKPSQAPDPSDIGCSAAALAQAWSLNLYDGNESAASQVGNFIQACAAYSLASVRFNASEIGETSGQQDHFHRLLELAQGDHSHLDGILDKCIDQTGTLRCVILKSSSGNNQSILYVACAADKAVMLISTPQLADVISVWRDLSEQGQR